MIDLRSVPPVENTAFTVYDLGDFEVLIVERNGRRKAWKISKRASDYEMDLFWRLMLPRSLDDMKLAAVDFGVRPDPRR